MLENETVTNELQASDPTAELQSESLLPESDPSQTAAKETSSLEADEPLALSEPEESKPNRMDSLLDQESAMSEYSEFLSLFPQASLHSLPDSVRRSVNSGVPLSAAYALYEKKMQRAQEIAGKVNEKNSKKSFALNSSGYEDSYFSPDEVRAMSARQVRENYNKIIESMRHWR